MTPVLYDYLYPFHKVEQDVKRAFPTHTTVWRRDSALEDLTKKLSYFNGDTDAPLAQIQQDEAYFWQDGDDKAPSTGQRLRRQFDFFDTAFRHAQQSENTEVRATFYQQAMIYAVHPAIQRTAAMAMLDLLKNDERPEKRELYDHARWQLAALNPNARTDETMDKMLNNTSLVILKPKRDFDRVVTGLDTQILDLNPSTFIHQAKISFSAN